MSVVNCRECSKEIYSSARSCVHCGARQNISNQSNTDKRIVPAGLLCFMFGVFGVHRFYVGKIGTGILMILTIGGLGIWAMVDLIFIIMGIFRDADGNKITEWI